MKLKITDVYPSRIYSEPKLIERKDPVVYPQDEAGHILTAEQLTFYERNGTCFLIPFSMKRKWMS
jgi:ectoine hydroxylase